MNQTFSFEELQALLASLLSPSALTELGLLLACMGLAWLIVWRLKQRVQQRARSVLLGSHVVDGVLFPVLALLLALGARRAIPLLGLKVAVFKLVIPVLTSLVVIRLIARVLRAALPDSGWIRLLERSVSWLAWGGSILWIIGVLPMVMEELDDVRWKVGATQVSLRAMIEGGLTAAFVLVLALWISSAIEQRLLRNTSVDLSMRKIAANLTRALLMFIGLLVALTAAGIDLTALGVLGGALGVGIGFGLQKLAANYVSGFVILAERSLRIGDMVKVDNFEGRISDIKTRYTVIRALNGREAIIPNETLITQRVENSSLADPQVLLSTVVQVAYGCEIEAVMAQLAEAVKAVPRVLQQPGPAVQLSSFAADGLELTVMFWIADPENGQGGVRSDVNLAILRCLNALGVEIPYPQRVVHQVQAPFTQSATQSAI
ncbi:mechanosensitive ion channel [Paucibacter sediminis]|uniref:Mechanosensitive ion channel n=1 Tax=Paucibacter sediminis TaxID=3019553 RepID=A0AA95NEV8_9BURK|nr:mechanosensitive ion channel domain-containing protein [Paucibacter sp. S2-9]WIT11597.1 mechanosensitive ion channel [Paucibacter sp. S2-9]